MKYLKISLYNLSFLILTKKGACSQFIYSCVCRAPCCAFSVKNHGVSVNSLALSSVFRYICYIKYQFLSNTGLSKTGSMDNRPGVLSLFTFSIDPVFFFLSPPVSRQIYLIYLFYPSSKRLLCLPAEENHRPDRIALAQNRHNHLGAALLHLI